MLGCAIGLLGVAVASRLLGSFLFGVSPFDPLVLTLAAVFVRLLAWLASLLPARRAASIDLMTVLRGEGRGTPGASSMARRSMRIGSPPIKEEGPIPPDQIA